MKKSNHDDLNLVTPEIYRRFREALSTGKWIDGTALNTQQKETVMNAVLLWEQQNDLPADQRIGYMESSCKSDANNSEVIIRHG